MAVASTTDGRPSWLGCSAGRSGDDGSARVAMPAAGIGAGGAGDVPTSTVELELELLCRECSEEHKSCDSECRARGDRKSVSPSFARSESGIVIIILLVALEGASAGL